MKENQGRFVFGPEHVGKRVRHVDGSKGVVLAVERSNGISNQLVTKLNVGEGESVQIVCYSLEGKVFASDKDAVIFLDESETAPAETDAPDLQAKVKELERLTSRIAEIEQNERLLPIKQFPWTIEYKSTPIDPTAQKIEALKLLFPWRDKCNFMTVNYCDGKVCQWSERPDFNTSYWAGYSEIHIEVGQVDADFLLCQILISRHEQ